MNHAELEQMSDLPPTMSAQTVVSSHKSRGCTSPWHPFVYRGPVIAIKVP